ncbi:hypothetical protein [Azospirillum argentinense]|uniref:hypothetical protein n=1 Tax=Azospirillum argentinense TaxID=2970906 RepID=UPI0032DFCA82
MKQILTKKAVLLAKIEAEAGVDASPDINDAILVSEPTFAVEVTKLDRDNTAADLSPQLDMNGRKLARITFRAELRGNGRQHSGLLSDAPKIGRLIQACGFAEGAVTNTAEDRVGPVVPAYGCSPVAEDAAWESGGLPSAALKLPVLYTVTVTTGGPSGEAEVSVTPNNAAGGAAATGVVITSGEAISLGTSGATLTPTFVGNLSVGDTWRVMVVPVGIGYKPVSEAQKTVSLYLYLDGLLHKLLAGNGTFQTTAEAGSLGTIDFDFQGQYVPVADAPMPVGAKFETTLPPQVEKSLMTWGSKSDLVAAQWTFDLANTVSVRPDVNGTDGYSGMRITARAPTGGFDPEATLEADNPFWGDLASGAPKFFTAKVGTQPGNMVVIAAPQVQTSELGYGDRDGVRTYDLGMKFARFRGDDEVTFVFC